MNSDTVYVGSGVYEYIPGSLRSNIPDYVALNIKPGQKVIIGGYEFESEDLGRLLSGLMRDRSDFYDKK